MTRPLERIYIGRRFKTTQSGWKALRTLYQDDHRANPAEEARQSQNENFRSMSNAQNIPSVSVTYAQNGSSTQAQCARHASHAGAGLPEAGRAVFADQSPPASGKSRALMFIALDKLANQGVKQAIIVVPERSIGASFHDEPLSQSGFWADWKVEPKWNLCDAPGSDNGGKVDSVKAFLDSGDKVLVCTHASFRFAVDKFGVEAFDDRLIAVDEFHHVSANPDNKLGAHLGEFMARNRAHIVAMTGSYFRATRRPCCTRKTRRSSRPSPTPTTSSSTATSISSSSTSAISSTRQLHDEILKVLDPNEKTIVHIPNVNSRESTKDKIRRWSTSSRNSAMAGSRFKDRLPTGEDGRGTHSEIADLVDDDPAKRERVTAALRDSAQKDNRAHVDIIIALAWPRRGSTGLVRTRLDGRISFQPDGDRADHRSRYSGRTG